MQPKVLKYLLDIESVISEIETIKARIGNDFNVFTKDVIMQRALERELEIIGEAVRKLIELQPDIQISSSKKIIGLRNIISHAYDSIEPELIWGIIQRDVVKLSEEIQKLKGS
ncbi:MAG: DUF86 domain-containing protein [Crocinitomicaceae bacterium]|jgi:uncharacterized protein with HEPN domain|nr:DUF86 domain-containing protein [Crocinitomicaceae bacterium]MBK6951814.1 DUF86 domain-containing protein [Crocinitomicaceae bacterium]MBK9590798.1 DUF86 domain-containing protein [Crocinitomicaceae bacterium]